jgi:hypothetical protein
MTELNTKSEFESKLTEFQTFGFLSRLFGNKIF